MYTHDEFVVSKELVIVSFIVVCCTLCKVQIYTLFHTQCAAVKEKNPFGSFAPIREKCQVKWYVIRVIMICINDSYGV